MTATPNVVTHYPNYRISAATTAPASVAETREPYANNDNAANDSTATEMDLVLSHSEIEKLEQRFWALATGPEGITRRALLALLGHTTEELNTNIDGADPDTLEALFAVAESSIETLECLKQFVQLLETAQQRLFAGLPDSNNPS